MDRENLAMRIWDVLYPILLYYAIIVIVMFLTQPVFGADSAHYMVRQIAATLVALPVVYFMFYKPDALRARQGKAAQRKKADAKEAGKRFLPVVAIAAALGVSLNNLLCMSPLIGASEAFAQANEDFYAGAFAYQLIGSAFLTPILEETVYRGVVYARIRRRLGVLPSALLSAFLFGVMHFNIVQFFYALVLGVMLALFMEVGGHVKWAVAGHVTVNLISIVRTKTGILAQTVDGSAFAWVVSGALLSVGALGLYLFCRSCFLKRHPQKGGGT